MEGIEEDISNETELTDAVVWSNHEFTLSDFVEKYELPQLVRVESGYLGENERSTLSGGQLLTLHSLNKTPKVMCESSVDNVTVLPFLCPLKAEVYPLPRDLQHSQLTSDLIASTYKGKVKYLRVLQSEDDIGSCEVDDILKVKSVGDQGIQCINVATKSKVLLPYGSPALFAPLLDEKQYTLLEIKKKYGFPAKVRFPETRIERQLRFKNKDSSKAISSLGVLTVLGEFEETAVISTTISGSIGDTVCYRIPKDLEITIVVAEGFMSGDETYQRIVRTLHNGFQRTNLHNFEGLDVDQHVNAVNKGIENISLDVSTEHAPEAVKKRLCELRAKAYFKDNAKAPPIPARKPKSSLLPPTRPICTPISQVTPTFPPTPGPKSPPMVNSGKSHSLPTFTHPKSKQAKLHTLPHTPTRNTPTRNTPISNTPTTKPFIKQLQKALSVPNSVKSKFHRPRSAEGVGVGNQRTKSDNECTYVETSNVYQSLPDDSDVYSDIDATYTSERVYCKPTIPLPSLPGHTGTSNAPNYDTFEIKDGASYVPKQPWQPTRPTMPLPVPPGPIDPPRNQEVPATHDEIYEAIARIPLDISGLSVEEVGKVLVYLNMPGYVKLFASELIDGDLLKGMDKQTLEDLNVTNKFHIQKLLSFINGWRPNVSH